jgi:hypothetical protein
MGAMPSSRSDVGMPSTPPNMLTRLRCESMPPAPQIYDGNASMLNTITPSWIVFAALADQKVAEPLLERLDPPRRAAVVMALLAIAIVGIFLVACVMLGAHWARRLASRRHGPSRRHANIENERLRSALQPMLPADNTGETIIVNKRADDTVIGS